MRRIYSQARRTCIWLGEGTIVIAQFMAYVQRCGTEGLARFQTQTNTSPATALSEVFRHRYWSRLWIIQEVILAMNVVVRCRNQVLIWAEFVQLCMKLSELCGKKQPEVPWPKSRSTPSAKSPLSGSPKGDAELLHSISESTLLLLNQERRGEFVAQSRGLPQLLQHYGNAGCKDLRDRVFGLLGLIDDRNNPLLLNATGIVDYSQTSPSLYLKLMRHYPFSSVDDFALPLLRAFDLGRELAEISVMEAFVFVRVYPWSFPTENLREAEIIDKNDFVFEHDFSTPMLYSFVGPPTKHAKRDIPFIGLRAYKTSHGDAKATRLFISSSFRFNNDTRCKDFCQAFNRTFIYESDEHMKAQAKIPLAAVLAFAAMQDCKFRCKGPLHCLSCGKWADYQRDYERQLISNRVNSIRMRCSGAEDDDRSLDDMDRKPKARRLEH